MPGDSVRKRKRSPDKRRADDGNLSAHHSSSQGAMGLAPHAFIKNPTKLKQEDSYGTVSPTLESGRKEKRDNPVAIQARSVQQKEPRQHKKTFGGVSSNDKACRDTNNVDLGQTSRRKLKKKKRKKTPLTYHVNDGVDGNLSAHHSSSQGAMGLAPHAFIKNPRKRKQEDSNGTVSPTLESGRKEKCDTAGEHKTAPVAIQAPNVQQTEPRQHKKTFGAVSSNDKACRDTDNVDSGQTSRRRLKKKKRKKTPLTYHVNDGVKGNSASQLPAAIHVGVDRVNSNWKQLQATFRRGGAAKRVQDMKLKKPADTAGKSEVKHVESVNQRQSEFLSPKDANFRITKVLAMDCEMVGAGFDGKRSILARVSLVNTSGNVVYDKYVKPMEPVTDYRTKISGVEAKDLRNGENFRVVQKEVADHLLSRVLVGHSVQNDLKVMYLSHPKKNIRDTSTYPPLRGLSGQKQGLRNIAEKVLGVAIQIGAHCSVQDARAAMYIYQYMKPEWEAFMSKKGHA